MKGTFRCIDRQETGIYSPVLEPLSKDPRSGENCDPVFLGSRTARRFSGVAVLGKYDPDELLDPDEEIGMRHRGPERNLKRKVISDEKSPTRGKGARCKPFEATFCRH